MAEKKKNGFFKKIGKYFKDTAGEYKKIVWPTRQKVVNNTLVVIGVVLIAAVFIVGVDLLLSFLVNLLLGM